MSKNLSEILTELQKRNPEYKNITKIVAQVNSSGGLIVTRRFVTGLLRNESLTAKKINKVFEVLSEGKTVTVE